MAALKLDMEIPLADGAGHVRLTVDISDLGALSPENREFIADTCGEFCAFAGRALGARAATGPELADAPAIHNPDGAVLRGVTGSRIRDKL